MSRKSVLALAFGIGRIPRALASELENEGIVLSDDGVPMSLHFVKYRSPRNGFTGRKGLAGFVVLTRRRLVLKGYWETTDLPLERLGPENVRMKKDAPCANTGRASPRSCFEARTAQGVLWKKTRAEWRFTKTTLWLRRRKPTGNSTSTAKGSRKAAVRPLGPSCGGI